MRVKEILFPILVLSVVISGCGNDMNFSGKTATEVSYEETLPEEDVREETEEMTAVSGEKHNAMEATETVSEENPEALINESDIMSDYSQLSADKTVRIYDIEDGYMDVPYYPELPQCEYDWSLLSVDGQYISYNDDRYVIRTGVDVSKFQGDIDWSAVKEQGFDFAIIRLGFRGYGNGALVTDEYFEKNIKEAQAAGLEVGVYFLSQAIDVEEAAEEAEYTLSELKRCAVSQITYPVVVDSEKIKIGESRTVSMSNSELTDTVITYCEKIRQEGYTPAIYANSQWLTTRLDIRRLTDIDIWYADYQIMDNNEKPLYPYPFTLWQYTNHGVVRGISGDVDLNVYFEDKKGGE